MTTLFVRHTVSDYKAWRKVYDGFAPVQKAGGVKAETVYQAADNPDNVTVTHDFANVGEAQAFIKNPKLKEAMASAGVLGAPSMWITNKA